MCGKIIAYQDLFDALPSILPRKRLLILNKKTKIVKQTKESIEYRVKKKNEKRFEKQKRKLLFSFLKYPTKAYTNNKFVSRIS